MSLEVTGVITKILPSQGGEGKNGPWMKQSFVIDNNDQYNNIFCFEVWSPKKVEEFNNKFKEGDSITVSFNVDCREYQGKYYTTLKSWREVLVESPEQKVNNTEVHEAEVISSEEEDDMPF